MSHEELDPETGARKSVPLFDWTRPGTDGFLGHECQGADPNLTQVRGESLIQMGAWCVSDTEPKETTRSFTGSVPDAALQNNKQSRARTEGSLAARIVLLDSADVIVSTLGEVYSDELPIDGDLLMGAIADSSTSLRVFVVVRQEEAPPGEPLSEDTNPPAGHHSQELVSYSS